MSADVFGCYNWVGRGATGNPWAEARDVVNILQGIGLSPITKSYPTPHVSNAEDKEPWLRGRYDYNEKRLLSGCFHVFLLEVYLENQE